MGDQTNQERTRPQHHVDKNFCQYIEAGFHQKPHNRVADNAEGQACK